MQYSGSAARAGVVASERDSPPIGSVIHKFPNSAWRHHSGRVFAKVWQDEIITGSEVAVVLSKHD